MSTDIQDARDVLAKWRQDVSPGPWLYGDLGGPQWTVFGFQEDPFDSNVMHADSGNDARLTAGTAGNPELLDAIDGLLTHFEAVDPDFLPDVVGRIAAAIIVADERMSA